MCMIFFLFTHEMQSAENTSVLLAYTDQTMSVFPFQPERLCEAI